MPDNVVWDLHTEEMLFYIECKGPDKYPESEVNHGDLVAEYLNPARNETDKNQSPVLQIYCYMVDDGMKYGILTTGIHTWFVYRTVDNDGLGTLHVSQSFKVDQQTPSLGQAMAIFIHTVRNDEAALNVP